MSLDRVVRVTRTWAGHTYSRLLVHGLVSASEAAELLGVKEK